MVVESGWGIIDARFPTSNFPTLQVGVGVMDFYISFPSPPPIGTKLRYYRKRVVTLEGVEPYVRRDGSDSFVLRWVTDEGERGTSGLTAKGINFKSGGAA